MKRRRVPEPAVAATGSYWHMDEDKWYESVTEHWCHHVSSEDDDGVLGGYGAIDAKDAAGSLDFVEHWRPRGGSFAAGTRALDCGAGIGRVTCGVLARVCERVDLVEVSAALLEQARKNLAQLTGRVGFEQESLRTFAPERAAYDVIWLQWVLGHLTDRDVLALLVRCRAGLRAGGVVVVKDNNAPPSMCGVSGGRFMLDEENAAVIRSYKHLLALFRRAGFKVQKMQRQADFPEELHTVRMFMLSRAAGVAEEGDDATSGTAA
eukprot:3465046-Prymnesium_polylepis.1